MDADVLLDSTIGAGFLLLLDRTDEPVEAAPLGRLLELAVEAADEVGSYWGGERTRDALRDRELRRPIAEALAARADAHRWAAPVCREQWWWTDGRPPERGPVEPLAWHWATHPRHALLTTSPLPDVGHWGSFDTLVTGVWDLCFGPAARWRVAIDPEAQVYEVHGPDDWADLVRRHPRDATAAWKEGHELYGADGGILGIPGQRAARRGWRRHLTPDWASVAEEWAGVHVSWLGYLTADGTVVDLDDGDVTVLRNWGSERTVWLRPVVTDAEPLPIPTAHLDDPPRPLDDDRWAAERAELLRSGRDPST